MYDIRADIALPAVARPNLSVERPYISVFETLAKEFIVNADSYSHNNCSILVRRTNGILGITVFSPFMAIYEAINAIKHRISSADETCTCFGCSVPKDRR